MLLSFIGLLDIQFRFHTPNRLHGIFVSWIPKVIDRYWIFNELIGCRFHSWVYSVVNLMRLRILYWVENHHECIDELRILKVRISSAAIVLNKWMERWCQKWTLVRSPNYQTRPILTWIVFLFGECGRRKDPSDLSNMIQMMELMMQWIRIQMVRFMKCSILW